MKYFEWVCHSCTPVSNGVQPECMEPKLRTGLMPQYPNLVSTSGYLLGHELSMTTTIQINLYARIKTMQSRIVEPWAPVSNSAWKEKRILERAKILEIMPVSEDLHKGEPSPNWTTARRAKAFNTNSLLIVIETFHDSRFPGLQRLYIDDLQNMTGLDIYEDHRGIGIHFSASFECYHSFRFLLDLSAPQGKTNKVISLLDFFSEFEKYGHNVYEDWQTPEYRTADNEEEADIMTPEDKPHLAPEDLKKVYSRAIIIPAFSVDICDPIPRIPV